MKKSFAQWAQSFFYFVLLTIWMHELQYTSPSSSIYFFIFVMPFAGSGIWIQAFSYVCISFSHDLQRVGFLRNIDDYPFIWRALPAQNALLSKKSVANIILTNVAYGIAPFREKPTVMEATNKRMNVVVNFLYSSIIGRPPIYFLVQVLKLNSIRKKI